MNCIVRLLWKGLGEPLGFPRGHGNQGSPRLGFCAYLRITKCKSARSQGSSRPNLLGNLIWGGQICWEISSRGAHGSSTPFLRGLQSPGGGSEHFWAPSAALVLRCPLAEPRGEVVPAAESPQTQSKLEEVTLESWEVPKPRRAVALQGGWLRFFG